MIPTGLMQGIGMVFLGAGAIGAADLASYFSEPFFALGYLLSAVVLLGAGVVRLVRAF